MHTGFLHAHLFSSILLIGPSIGTFSLLHLISWHPFFSFFFNLSLNIAFTVLKLAQCICILPVKFVVLYLSALANLLSCLFTFPLCNICLFTYGSVLYSYIRYFLLSFDISTANTNIDHHTIATGTPLSISWRGAPLPNLWYPKNGRCSA